jgi:hypothetical protein
VPLVSAVRAEDARAGAGAASAITSTVGWCRDSMGPRNGALFCGACHERLTGKVAEKHLIESKHTFTVDHIAYINADKPCRFVRIA